MGLFGGLDWRRPQMVGIKAGSFMMGSPDDDRDAGSEEKPPHKVTIRKAFEIGKYPVTFAEWDAAAKEGACDGYRPDDRGWGRKIRPVINVSWEDVQAYITFLNKHTGKVYRVPSEAEWEYCCRAGKQTRYLWGDEPPPLRHGYANYLNNETVPVNSNFYKHPWGVMGLPGNVYEWCEDVWHDNYKAAPNDGSAWTEGGRDFIRVVRGGSWSEIPWHLRSAGRVRSDSVEQYINQAIGFRLARTL